MSPVARQHASTSRVGAVRPRKARDRCSTSASKRIDWPAASGTHDATGWYVVWAVGHQPPHSV